MDRAQQLSACLARAAARPQIARLTVRLAGTVAVDAVGWRLGPGRSSLLPIAAELLAAGASVAVVGMIVDEVAAGEAAVGRSEEHTSELQSLMRLSSDVFCLKK